MFKVSEKKINPLPRFFMLLSLPAFLYICLISIAFFDIIPLRVELHSIIIILLILLIFMLFIIHNAWYSFSLFRNSFNDIILQVDEYLESNKLTVNGITKSFGNIDNFFDEHLKVIRNDNFASVAASIFPTLGILGTFIAIAISMPDFSVESQEALESEITLLLNGVGTAFYASIYGIFLSLWWTFFEKRGLTKIEKDINLAKQYYKGKIWDEEEIKLVSLIQNKSQNDMLIEKLESIVTPEYIFSLDKIAKSKIETIENLNKEHIILEDRLTKDYNNLVELFNSTANKHKQIISEFEKLHDLLSQTNKSASNFMIEQNNNSKATRNEIYSVLSSLELVSSDLKSLGKTLIEKQIQISEQNEKTK